MIARFDYDLVRNHPDQFVRRLNELVEAVNKPVNMETITFAGPTSGQVYILGMQPSPPNPIGTWGLRLYNISSGGYTLVTVLI